MSDEVVYIDLFSNGESRFVVDLNGYLATFVTKFNYSARAWSLDILDADGVLILAGVMLVPNVDILYGYPQAKKNLGGLVLIEAAVGNYTIPDKLSTGAKLLWFPPGVEVGLP